MINPELERTMSSPTRTYVAFCNNGNFDGYYFRKFTLPETIEQVPSFAQSYPACYHIENNANYASWYFLNVLDSVACINGCLRYEDYLRLEDVKDVQARLDALVGQCEHESHPCSEVSQ